MESTVSIDLIQRRSLVCGAAAALALPQASFAAAAAAAGATANPAAIPDKLRTLLMMRGALDDRLVMHWIRGRCYGLVDGAMTPLFGVVNACFSRYRAREGGGFFGARGEVTYYTDFGSGEVVQTALNPYTNAAMPLPARGYPPSPVRIQADATIAISEAPGVEFRNVVDDPQVSGNDVSLCESSMAKTPLPGGGVSLYNEVLTYRAKANDLARTDLKRVACDIAVTSTVSWRSWMGMGDRPGVLLTVGTGSFVSSIDELPPAWVKAASQSRPELLANPLAFLDPAWSSKS
jgi:hypothetical protein